MEVLNPTKFLFIPAQHVKSSANTKLKSIVGVSYQFNPLSFKHLSRVGCRCSVNPHVRNSSGKNRDVAIGSAAQEVDLVPIESSDPVHQAQANEERVVQGFADGGPYSLDLAGNLRAEVQLTQEDDGKMIDRLINAILIGAAGAYAVTKLVTVDQDYWHGWTIYEILRYAPLHNWSAYEEALKNNPVLAKMIISGTVYSLGDWMAQCYEGKPILEFNRLRMFRSGLVGFCLHGSLSHFYYYLCEALFPFQGWWVVPLKVGFDQTIWSAFWNSVYYITLGVLRLESPMTIWTELRTTFVPMLTAGWKLWPFAHLITYGVVPVEQRLLWVDCVELLWVTILSMYSNAKAEERILEASSDNTTMAVLDNKEENEDATNAN